MTPAATQTAASAPGTLLLIETRSPLESADVADFVGLATPLLDAGSCVQLHFIQNAVFWLEREPQRLRALQGHGGAHLQLTFDDFSLDQRGIPHALALQYGTVQTMGALVATMARATVKTIWHS